MHLYQIPILTLHIPLRKMYAAISRLHIFIFKVLQSENATLGETRNIIFLCFYLRVFAFFCCCLILVLAFPLCKTGLFHSLFLFSNWQTSYEPAVRMNGICRVVARYIACNNCEPSLDGRVNVNR